MGVYVCVCAQVSVCMYYECVHACISSQCKCIYLQTQGRREGWREEKEEGGMGEEGGGGGGGGGHRNLFSLSSA